MLLNTQKTRNINTAISNKVPRSTAPSPTEPRGNLTKEPEPPYLSHSEFYAVRIGIGQDWTAAKDKMYFDGNFDARISEGKERYKVLFEAIQESRYELKATLSEAALVVSAGRVDAEALHLLPIADLIALLRKLFVEHVPQVPSGHQRNYLFGLNDYLDQCEEVDRLYRSMLLQFALNPDSLWLAELGELDDWLVTCRVDFDQIMESEHCDIETGCEDSSAAKN
jgi:hypothetical protein